VSSKSHQQLKSIDAPVLETARLILRLPTEEDFEGWAAFSADPETMRYLGGPQSREIAWRVLATMAGCWALRGFGMFSVIERQSGRWIGRVGPWRPEGWPGNEVGWGILREFEGNGYAFEASVAAIDWAFDVLAWESVIHCVPEVNPAPGHSRSVWARPANALSSCLPRRARKCGCGGRRVSNGVHGKQTAAAEFRNRGGQCLRATTAFFTNGLTNAPYAVPLP